MNHTESTSPWAKYVAVRKAQVQAKGKPIDPKETMYGGETQPGHPIPNPPATLPAEQETNHFAAYAAYPPELRNSRSVLREARASLKGSTASFLLILFFYAQLMVLTGMVTWFFLVPWQGSALNTTFNDILLILAAMTLILVPFAGGIPGAGLLLATGFKGMFENTLFEYLDLTPRYLALYILTIGAPLALAYRYDPAFLALIPLLAAPFVFTGIFMADQNLRLFPAMKASAHLIRQNFKLVFSFTTRIIGLYLLGVLTLGIGLIWVIPTHIAGVGVLYKSIHGLEHMSPRARHSA